MGLAAIQFSGFGLCAAAFIYGLATNENGKCEADGYYFCVVFRIALAFDLLLGYTPLLVFVGVGLTGLDYFNWLGLSVLGCPCVLLKHMQTTTKVVRRNNYYYDSLSGH